MVLEDANAYSYDAIMFRADSMNVPKREQNISIVYYPSINEFNGKRLFSLLLRSGNKIGKLKRRKRK